MDDFTKFVEWGFYGIMAGGVGWSATFLSKISKSISELNVQVAKILERTAWQQQELEKHEERIGRLEVKSMRK